MTLDALNLRNLRKRQELVDAMNAVGSREIPLLMVLSRVREAAEREFRSTLLKSCCAVVSATAWKACQCVGLDVVLVGGEYATKENVDPHCWLEFDGRIFDLTRTQYKPTAPPISRLEKPQPEYREIRRHEYPEDLDFISFQLEWIGALDAAIALEKRLLGLLADDRG